MSGVNKFNRQEYAEKISKMSSYEFANEWAKVTKDFQERRKNSCVKIVKNYRGGRTSTGRRFIYGKVEQ